MHGRDRACGHVIPPDPHVPTQHPVQPPATSDAATVASASSPSTRFGPGAMARIVAAATYPPLAEARGQAVTSSSSAGDERVEAVDGGMSSDGQAVEGGDAVEVERQLVAREQRLDRLPALAVVGRQAVLADRGAVLAGRVARVPVPAVDRVARVELVHHPVAHDLRDDRRARDRVAQVVAVDDRACTGPTCASNRRSGCRRPGRGRGRRAARSRGTSRDASRGRCSAGRSRGPTPPPPRRRSPAGG